MPEASAKLWRLNELDGLEFFQAKSVRFSYARHMHESYSIGVIESGVGGNYYRGATHFSPAGSIVLMNPGDVHTGYSAGDHALSYRMLYIKPDLLERLLPELGSSALRFQSPVVRNAELARKIHHLHSQSEFTRDLLLQEALLVETISAAGRAYGNVNLGSECARTEHRAVSLIKEFIQSHYADNITLEHLTDVTGLNPSYMIRIFRREVGLPPYTYLTQVRVEQAKLLLLKGEAVAKVALATGFADQSHLTRFFKRIVGLTPGRYAEGQYRSRRNSS